ncbi:MAG: GNAT family N-acetyltransferase [Dehalococcoidia bacterium]
MKLIVYADGASRGNPGPASIGASVRDETGTELATVSERIGHATNNVAEYRAAIEGVRKAKTLGATNLELCMDSELIVRQLAGMYRVKHPALQPLYATLMAELEEVAWSVGHVPRAQNARADALANAALDGKRVDDVADPSPPEPAPETGLRYVDFRREHLPGVIALCADEGWPSFPEDPPRALRALTAPGVKTVVAVDDDVIVGFAYGQGDGEIEAHLSNLVVTKSHRRRGIARRLVEEVFRRTGGTRMDLLAEPGSEAFYESFEHRELRGFRIWPRR